MNDPAPISLDAESDRTRVRATEPQFPSVPPNNDTLMPSSSSNTVSQLPTTTPPRGKIPAFRDLVTMIPTEERLSAYEDTRRRFADMDTGLQSWMSSIVAAHPEHINVGTQRYEGPARINPSGRDEDAQTRWPYFKSLRNSPRHQSD